MVKRFLRALMGISKSVSPEQAEEVARKACEKKNKEWLKPILIIEFSSYYDVLTEGGRKGALYVRVDIQTGRVLGIYGPLSR